MRRAAAVLGLVALLAGCDGGDPPFSPTPATPTTAVLGAEDPAGGAPVPVGLLDVEGDPAVGTPAVGDAAEAAAEYANEHLGGLGGRPIEVLRCADRADGTSAARCAERFVRRGVAAVVVGQAATPDTVIPVLRAAGIPYVGAFPAGAAELGDDGAFFLSPGFPGLLAAQALHSRAQGFARVTVLAGADPQLRAAVDGVGRPLFAAQGVTLDVVPVRAADAAAQVAAATADRPDAVAVLADSAVCAAVLRALRNVDPPVPTYVTAPCVASAVLDRVGRPGIDGTVLFTTGDTGSDEHEAALYRAVLQRYRPDTDPSGSAVNGYLAMLGLVRGAADGGLAGEVTPWTVTAALEVATDVPLPAGAGARFSCDATAFPNPAIRATICASTVIVSTYDGGTPSEPRTVDAAAALR